MFSNKMKLLVAAAGGALLLLVVPACGAQSNSAQHKTHASEVYKSDDGRYYAQSYDPTLDALVWYLLLNPTNNSSAPIINSAGAGGLSGYTWQTAPTPPASLTSTGAAVRVDENGKPSETETAFEDVVAAAAEGDIVDADTNVEEAQSNFDATEQTNLDIDNGDVGGDVGDSGGSDGSDGGGFDGGSGGYDGGGYDSGGFDGGGFDGGF